MPMEKKLYVIGLSTRLNLANVTHRNHIWRIGCIETTNGKGFSQSLEARGRCALIGPTVPWSSAQIVEVSGVKL